MYFSSTDSQRSSRSFSAVIRADSDDRLSEIKRYCAHISGYRRAKDGELRTVHLNAHLNKIFGRVWSTGIVNECLLVRT